MKASVAAIYARVSTVEQAGPGKASIERQIEECRLMAAQDGYSVPERLVFQDRESGAKADRPAFLAMKAAAGQFQRLYVWAQDRLTRGGMKPTLDTLDELNASGVTVHSPYDGDLTNELLAGIRGWMAGQERKRMLERTLPARMRKRAAGYWVMGQAPYGYRVQPDKTLAPCPNESLVLRRIFDLACSGYGQIQIARILNTDGVPPPEALVMSKAGQKKRVRIGHNISGDKAFLQALRGKELTLVEHNGRRSYLSHALPNTILEVLRLPQWQKSSVRKVLTNPAAFGESDSYECNPVTKVREFKGRYQLKIDPCPIINEMTFERARSEMRKRNTISGVGQQRSADWLLSGHLVCGSCVSNYIHHADRDARPKGKRGRRYSCNGRRSGKGCKNPSIAMEKADTQVIEAVSVHLHALLSRTNDIERYIQGHSQTEVSNLKSDLGGRTEAREKAVEQHAELLAELRAMSKAGAQDSALQPLVNELNAADDRVKQADQEIADIQTRLIRINADLVAQGDDVRRIALRMQHALELVTPDGDATTDLRVILEKALRSATVRSDGTLDIQLEDGTQAVRSCISALADTELEWYRNEQVG